VPPDERLSQTATGSGFVSDPSTSSALGSPFTATALSPPAQSPAGTSTEYNMFGASPSVVGETSRQDKMVDVGNWAAESTEVSGFIAPDSGSEDDSDDDFMDANSDGDTDIESVTDV
jgi:hypothetical protein